MSGTRPVPVARHGCSDTDRRGPGADRDSDTLQQLGLIDGATIQVMDSQEVHNDDFTGCFSDTVARPRRAEE